VAPTGQKKHGWRGGFGGPQILRDQLNFNYVESISADVPRHKREDPAILRVIEYHTRFLHRVARVVNLPFTDIVSFAKDDIFRHPVDVGQKRIRVKSVQQEGWDNKLLDPKEVQMALDYPKDYEIIVVDGSKLYIFYDLVIKICNNWGFSEIWAKNADKVVDTSEIYREEAQLTQQTTKFTPGMDIVINPPEGNQDCFWLARVLSVSGSTIRVCWYEKVPLSESRYKTKNAVDDIPITSVFEHIRPIIQALGGNQFMLENEAEVTRLVWVLFADL